MEERALDHLLPVEGTTASVHPAYKGPLPGVRNISEEDCSRGIANCKALRAKFAAIANRRKAQQEAANSEHYRTTVEKFMGGAA